MLKSHSLACYPEEACALLVGRADVVEEIVITANIAENPRQFFEVDPGMRIRTEKKCRDTAQSIIGVFHSHPDGKAHPSQADARMVIERHFFWLIASVLNGRQFRLEGFLPHENEAGFSPVQLSLEEE